MKVIDSLNLQSDMFDEKVIADIALRRTIEFRLNFWSNICKKPVSHGVYYWNSSPEHRLIAMLAVASALNQIPLYLISGSHNNNFFFSIYNKIIDPYLREKNTKDNKDGR